MTDIRITGSSITVEEESVSVTSSFVSADVSADVRAVSTISASSSTPDVNVTLKDYSEKPKVMKGFYLRRPVDTTTTEDTLAFTVSQDRDEFIYVQEPLYLSLLKVLTDYSSLEEVLNFEVENHKVETVDSLESFSIHIDNPHNDNVSAGEVFPLLSFTKGAYEVVPIAEAMALQMSIIKTDEVTAGDAVRLTTGKLFRDLVYLAESLRVDRYDNYFVDDYIDDFYAVTIYTQALHNNTDVDELLLADPCLLTTTYNYFDQDYMPEYYSADVVLTEGF